MTNEREGMCFTEICAVSDQKERTALLTAYVERMDALGMDTKVVRKAKRMLKVPLNPEPKIAQEKPLENLPQPSKKSVKKPHREQMRGLKGKRAKHV